MSFKDKSIKITCWSGKILFIGDYDDEEVDTILDANRCDCEEGCEECDNTGYKGDFQIEWIDHDDKKDCNVYEYVNY